MLAGDFNTVAPGDFFDTALLPMRLRPLVWMSGGRIRWRTVQTVLDAGYVDAFRQLHPGDPGLTLPAASRTCGSTMSSSPPPRRGWWPATWCTVPPPSRPPITYRWSPT